MATYKSFTEIEVWQKARDLSVDIFKLTIEGSFARDFALKDQINRSTGSIMDNIAEGFDRGGRKELINFLSYSRGSCGETVSQLYRAFDRKHISMDDFERLKNNAETVGKMLTGFIGYLTKSNIAGFKFKGRS